MTTIKGIPIVLSGPSGVGKGTVISQCMKNPHDLVLSVSMTTRPPRPGEEEGIDYYFRSKEQFESAIHNDELVEWAKVYDHYYGTPKSFLNDQFDAGKDVILDIDVQGAASVRSLYHQDSILIFLVPPSLDELKRRLYSRKKGSGDDLEHRVSQCKREMRFIGMYDYVVINDKVEQAVHDLNAIITANRLLRKRMEPYLKKEKMVE